MRVCAAIGCDVSLEGRRKDAVFCSGRCRLRSQRLIAEFGFELADWQARSERFWEGMRALDHRAGRGSAEYRDRARQDARRTRSRGGREPSETAR